MPHVERLKQLRRVIEAAPEDRLHMRAFAEKAACGTAHCAAGFAAIDPWFRRNTEIADAFAITDLPGGRVEITAMPGTWRVLGALFDLADDDVTALFGGGINWSRGPHAVSKTEVLWNIDRLLAGERALPYAAAFDDDPREDPGDDAETPVPGVHCVPWAVSP